MGKSDLFAPFRLLRRTWNAKKAQLLRSHRALGLLGSNLVCMGLRRATAAGSVAG